jgi:hypothetical protein
MEVFWLNLMGNNTIITNQMVQVIDVLNGITYLLSEQKPRRKLAPQTVQEIASNLKAGKSPQKVYQDSVIC